MKDDGRSEKVAVQRAEFTIVLLCRNYVHLRSGRTEPVQEDVGKVAIEQGYTVAEESIAYSTTSTHGAFSLPTPPSRSAFDMSCI
jgi:hypothetical protein